MTSNISNLDANTKERSVVDIINPNRGKTVTVRNFNGERRMA